MKKYRKVDSTLGWKEMYIDMWDAPQAVGSPSISIHIFSYQMICNLTKYQNKLEREERKHFAKFLSLPNPLQSLAESKPLLDSVYVMYYSIYPKVSSSMC